MTIEAFLAADIEESNEKGEAHSRGRSCRVVKCGNIYFLRHAFTFWGVIFGSTLELLESFHLKMF